MFFHKLPKDRKVVNPIRTGFFGECVSLEEGFSHPEVYSFIYKSRVFKFGTQLKMGKIYYKKQC